MVHLLAFSLKQKTGQALRIESCYRVILLIYAVVALACVQPAMVFHTKRIVASLPMAGTASSLPHGSWSYVFIPQPRSEICICRLTYLLWWLKRIKAVLWLANLTLSKAFPRKKVWQVCLPIRAF